MHRSLKKSTSKETTPLWLVTFADTMSLLLAFFVLLFSFCDVKTGKVIEYDASQSVMRRKIMEAEEKKDIYSQNKDYGGRTGMDADMAPLYHESNILTTFDKWGRGLGGGELFQEQMEEVFYKAGQGIKEIAEVKVKYSGREAKPVVYFALKNIFGADSAFIRFKTRKFLRELAGILGELPNDIIVESYAVPHREKASQVKLYIERIEQIAEFLIRTGDIIPERIGISEASALYMTDESLKLKDETYSGIRLVLVAKSEGYKQFLKKIKTYGRR